MATITARPSTRIKTISAAGPWANCGGGWEQQQTKGNNMTGSLHIGLAALGSAIGVGIIGMKAAEATGRNPGAAGAIRNQAIIFAALAEGVVFFAIFLAK
ncbi:MAG: ATP synthase F0 subunit C [Verrucomicrobia bacterium]|nr:ATP synthase F0 subunit C [Verrucomicrobiota bacterium]